MDETVSSCLISFVSVVVVLKAIQLFFVSQETTRGILFIAATAFRTESGRICFQHRKIRLISVSNCNIQYSLEKSHAFFFECLKKGFNVFS